MNPTDLSNSPLMFSDDKSYYRYDQFGNNPMTPVGPVAIVPLLGSADFSKEVNDYLKMRRNEYTPFCDGSSMRQAGHIRDDYRVDVVNARFSTGEGKGVISQTVRGHDLFIISDITNNSVTYKMRGFLNRMSPDDHYQDLKRIILAASGKARRINVVMPYLYEGRQHRRSARESLDCAYMLEELHSLGVDQFITFDAHDDRVANAIPIACFENFPTTYQVLKKMFRETPMITFDSEHTMVVSPDEGGISRAMYYASVLGLPLGTFYKRRDYSRIVNGRNPIIAHEFLGDSVEGMDIMIVDDMISSGESMLDLARILKERKANRIYCIATFGLFTDGLQSFDQAYADGAISGVFCTNLIYSEAKLLEAPWYRSVNMAKYVALIIDAINHNASLSSLVDPNQKIEALLDGRHEASAGRF